MNDMTTKTRRKGRRGSGRNSDETHTPTSPPFLTRSYQPFEILNEQQLALIEQNAETILEETGVLFHDEEVLSLLSQAGAEVSGNCAKFPRGFCRELIEKHAPSSFVQHARNPKNNVTIGKEHTVFSPGYGAPFVRCLDKGRRYATLEDFENFVKLAYLSPYMHHSGGVVVEPCDTPVETRHLDMAYAHMRYSDKAFMGSVTDPKNAEDTIAMCKILFGDSFVKENTVVMGLINGNSPLQYDDIMLGAAKVYARHNQGVIITPAMVSGAMAPASIPGTLAQWLAEALAGIALIQIINPGTPCILGILPFTVSMQSGSMVAGTPEPALMTYSAGQIARRLNLPLRSGGCFATSKIADAQAGYESANNLQTTLLSGVNFAMHSAGWLEAGLTMGYEKFELDLDQLGMAEKFCAPIDFSESEQGLDAIREVGPAGHFLGCRHTKANFRTAFYLSNTCDYSSFEQWQVDGSLSSEQRANQIWKNKLASYQPPAIDPAIDQALLEFIDQRKQVLSKN